MQEFVNHFVRDVDGSWTCVSPATLRFEFGVMEARPGDRFMPGDIVKGTDIAYMLDRAIC